jgi:hypothetical protein
LRRQKSKDSSYEKQKIELNNKKNNLKNEKEKEILSELGKLANEIKNNNWNLSISKTIHKNKDVFSINKNDPAAYFVSKQLQYNIKTTYKVKQNNYCNIVDQLKNILFTTFPLYVIKTDIESFYEKIDTSKLINKVKEDTLLSIFSKKIITTI